MWGGRSVGSNKTMAGEGWRRGWKGIGMSWGRGWKGIGRSWRRGWKGIGGVSIPRTDVQSLFVHRWDSTQTVYATCLQG